MDAAAAKRAETLQARIVLDWLDYDRLVLEREVRE